MDSKLLSSISDRDLEQERLLLDGELATAQRWGDDETALRDAIRQIAREQHARRLARVRNAAIHLDPWIIDDPGVKPRSAAPFMTGPVITGAAKARAERAPPRVLLVGALAFASLFLVASLALAIPRLAELDDRYAAMERV